MKNLTAKQHHVPQFYLSQWQAAGKETVHCYDLVEKKHFTQAPRNILTLRNFYEEDPANPDNRMEDHLAEMEGESAAVFRSVAAIDFSDLRKDDKRGYMQRATKALTPEVCSAIKKFANYQYLRVPGVIAAKRGELQASALTPNQLDHHLNPGRFVEAGVAYTEGRFQSLRIKLCLSQSEDFITSDWPCFDMHDSEMAPAIGEDIGRKPGVVCVMPLNPRMAAIFYPESFNPMTALVPNGFGMVLPPAEVRNFNVLVIQQAGRFVVTRNQSDFVFKVAAKRKKAAASWGTQNGGAHVGNG
ncbi:DUF4238 domain-containing protein [Paraburkholderia sp. EG287A]|uniref:DUF4238 domain-containing protein n=1 Tax=Paraburkholderia sp. EG287A TaxID=3237012 RepID=UPI0034D2CC05